ncbi:MAG TPA: phospho-N-acetylmuramoyl-pentapeptide-transferase [Candidatus Binatia bacterium]|nr:phospho-N-acetylmuramoyl-pentapeptide-transferase [Candidatus Binatia bacterium]
MIYNILVPLAAQYSQLNVLRYITFRALVAAVLALLLSFLLGPSLIRRLRTGQFGQPVSAFAPESHAAKKGTPTMGGLLIVTSLGLSTLLLSDLTNVYVLITLMVTLGFSAVGFVDDWQKVRQKRNDGMSAREKILWQFMIASIGMAVLWSRPEFDPHLAIPFFKDVRPDLGWMYIPFGAVVIVGASNAVNLTDGLDGLAIGPVMTTASTLAILTYCAGHAVIAEYLLITHVPGAGELAIICGATAMAGLGFLWFNAHPAQMFMGDVGSLALGAVLGMVAVVSKNELVLLVAGGVFVVEALSVIIQIGSIKLRGKRVFLMAPIHHHFEKAGWPETQVVIRCWIISLMCALISLATLKLR